MKIENLKQHFPHCREEAEEVYFFQTALEDVASWSAHFFLFLLREKPLELEILPAHQQHFSELLHISTQQQCMRENPLSLTKQELLEEKGKLMTLYPRLGMHINLLHQILEHYLQILVGQESVLNFLFPNGRFDVAVELYHRAPEAAYYNHLTAKAVRYFVGHLLLTHGVTGLNILEIGAGTGGTTAALLPLLSTLTPINEYRYTDISPAFLSYGVQRYQNDFDFLAFSKFDINQAIAPQRLAASSYHLILATNVVHNALSLRNSVTPQLL